jgi:hypothetical protein
LGNARAYTFEVYNERASGEGFYEDSTEARQRKDLIRVGYNLLWESLVRG